MTTYTVTSNADSGPGTLRADLGLANNGDIINFAPNVMLISLTSPIEIKTNVIIEGSQPSSTGAPGITISGNAVTSEFTIDRGVTTTIDGVRLENGYSKAPEPAFDAPGVAAAGAIYDNGTLTLSNSIIDHNTSLGYMPNEIIAGSGGGNGGFAVGGILTGHYSTLNIVGNTDVFSNNTGIGGAGGTGGSSSSYAGGSGGAGTVAKSGMPRVPASGGDSGGGVGGGAGGAPYQAGQNGRGYGGGGGGGGGNAFADFGGVGAVFVHTGGATSVTLSEPTEIFIDGVVQDGSPSDVVVSGLGPLTLTGLSTYTGKTSVSGTLDLAGSASIHSSTKVSLTTSGATLDVSGATAGEVINKLGGVAGTVTDLGDQNLKIKVQAGIVDTYAGILQDGGAAGGTGGSLTLGGPGELILTAAESYTGATTLAAGTLALSGAGSIAASSGLSLASGSTFDMSGETAATIQELTGVAGATVDLGAGTLTISENENDDTSTFAGVIADGGLSGGAGGSLTVTQLLNLTGVSTYTGKTSVSGYLEISGSGSIHSSSKVSLTTAGATLDISGATAPVVINKLGGVAGTVTDLGSSSNVLKIKVQAGTVDTPLRTAAGRRAGRGHWWQGRTRRNRHAGARPREQHLHRRHDDRCGHPRDCGLPGRVFEHDHLRKPCERQGDAADRCGGAAEHWLWNQQLRIRQCDRRGDLGEPGDRPDEPGLQGRLDDSDAERHRHLGRARPVGQRRLVERDAAPCDDAIEVELRDSLRRPWRHARL